MVKTPESKATSDLIKKYPVCMVACLDDFAGLHYSFSTRKGWNIKENSKLTILMILAMKRDKFIAEGKSEKEFWEMLHEGVETLGNGLTFQK